MKLAVTWYQLLRQITLIATFLALWKLLFFIERNTQTKLWSCLRYNKLCTGTCYHQRTFHAYVTKRLTAPISQHLPHLGQKLWLLLNLHINVALQLHAMRTIYQLYIHSWDFHEKFTLTLKANSLVVLFFILLWFSKVRDSRNV